MRTYPLTDGPLTAVSYNPATGDCDLTFKSGNIYRYKSVTRGSVAALMFPVDDNMGMAFKTFSERYQEGSYRLNDDRKVQFLGAVDGGSK